METCGSISRQIGAEASVIQGYGKLRSFKLNVDEVMDPGNGRFSVELVYVVNIILMAYIPPHKRHSKDSERPSPTPELLVPQFKRNFNLRSSKHNVDRSGKIVYADQAISRWLLAGLDDDNQFPCSVHLEPVSVELVGRRSGEKPLVLVNSNPANENGEVRENISRSPWESVAENVWPDLLSSFEIVRNKMECENLEEVKPSLVARFGKILFSGYAISPFNFFISYYTTVSLSATGPSRRTSRRSRRHRRPSRVAAASTEAFYAYKVGVFIVMAYIPPHKRHSKDPERPSPIPERLVPQFPRQINLKSSSKVNRILNTNARNMYIVGLDADNQFPSSVHLKPISVEYCIKQRILVTTVFVLVDSHPATKEIDKEGEAISSTPSETISSTPWESMAVDVWPNLLSAFEIVRNMLESNDELDEVKPAIFARFGKIFFHPYLSDSTKPLNSGIYCKCRMKEDKKLELYKVETKPIHEMTKKILCIDKNLDLRLTLDTKRILTSLTDDEMHNIGNIINSAVIDPEVMGGLRWPYGKACFGDRFAVVEIWHTIAKKYKSPSLSLMARHVDRFNFEDAYRQESIEVYLKLKRLVADLQVKMLFIAFTTLLLLFTYHLVAK
ncbi:hypothetical protein EZV62_007420 [Acer yangbiense]|uniref:DUF7903 domain-containing protein n=1 Tax=Acer yangbiense TaxID=1000413 RepID=A0A5C7IA87_9ROSI|nr:hypothetical protein EZV62_007420 [Acer yangbiense]